MTIWLLQLSGYLIALLVLWPTGNAFTRMLLERSGATSERPSKGDSATNPMSAASKTVRAGRYIGALERLLIVIGVVVRSWEVVAAVVALKSVARYKELDKQISAEYFLIGSLASIAWAVVIGIAIVWYDDTYGWKMAAWAAAKLTGN